MILNATTKKIQVVLGEAKTTTDCAVVADYYDSGVTPAGNTQVSNSNGTSVVDVVSAPASGYTRIINGLTVENDDTVSHTVTVQFNDNGTTYKIIKATLAPGYTLTFAKSHGWAVMSPTGLFIAGQIPGTNTNDNAAAGMVGEYIESDVPVSSEFSITSTAVFDVTHLTLTPGDWNVWGTIAVDNGSGATVLSTVIGWLNTTSVTQPAAANKGAFTRLTYSVTGNEIIAPVGMRRYSVNTNTNVYLSGQAVFTNTAFAFGFIGARRMR